MGVSESKPVATYPHPYGTGGYGTVPPAAAGGYYSAPPYGGMVAPAYPGLSYPQGVYPAAPSFSAYPSAPSYPAGPVAYSSAPTFTVPSTAYPSSTPSFAPTFSSSLAPPAYPVPSVGPTYPPSAPTLTYPSASSYPTSFVPSSSTPHAFSAYPSISAASSYPAAPSFSTYPSISAAPSYPTTVPSYGATYPSLSANSYPSFGTGASPYSAAPIYGAGSSMSSYGYSPYPATSTGAVNYSSEYTTGYTAQAPPAATAGISAGATTTAASPAKDPATGHLEANQFTPARLEQKAAEGDIEAQIIASMASTLGWWGFSKDPAAGKAFLSKAVSQGDALAANLQALMNGAGNESEAWKALKAAADSGSSPLATYTAAVVLEEGGVPAFCPSVVPDKTTSLALFQKASSAGFVPAEGWLAYRILTDNDPSNDLEGVEYYRKTAEQGYTPAYFRLGGAYEKGLGVTQSVEEAVKWYKKAAEAGFAPALDALKRLGR